MKHVICCIFLLLQSKTRPESFQNNNVAARDRNTIVYVDTKVDKGWLRIDLITNYDPTHCQLEGLSLLDSQAGGHSRALHAPTQEEALARLVETPKLVVRFEWCVEPFLSGNHPLDWAQQFDSRCHRQLSFD
jgi:hypothetical protein